MKSTLMTSVFSRHLHLWYQSFPDIYIYDINVSDMTSTLITSVYRNKTVVTTFVLLCFEILTWYLVCECIIHIKFTFHFGPMIFGRVIICHHFFPLGYIDLICGIWVHSDQLQIKFTFRSGPMILEYFRHDTSVFQT